MTDTSGIGDIAERAFINTPQQVEALAGKVRMRILKAAGQPLSVREMAESLGVPATRLYYHVNLLEGAGFLDVVETRKSGARVENLYRAAARSFGAGPDLAKNVDNIEDAAAALTGLVMDATRIEAEAAIAHRLSGGSDEADLARTEGKLTPAQIAEIRNRITAILEEVAAAESDDPSARNYSFTYLLVPTELDE